MMGDGMGGEGMNEVDSFIRMYLHRYGANHGKVLDIGCGPAPYRHWVRGDYVGLDLTAAPYGAIPRRVDVVASAMCLPFAAEAFDLVFSKSAFFLIPDPALALREVHRVLAPGGRIVLFDYNRRTQRALERKEGVRRPAWTQWRLRAIVAHSGFRRCEILLAKDVDLPRPARWIGAIWQELFGTWAIVTGIR